MFWYRQKYFQARPYLFLHSNNKSITKSRPKSSLKTVSVAGSNTRDSVSTSKASLQTVNKRLVSYYKVSRFTETHCRAGLPSFAMSLSFFFLSFIQTDLTHYRPAIPFGNRKIYLRGSFQSLFLKNITLLETLNIII